MLSIIDIRFRYSTGLCRLVFEQEAVMTKMYDCRIDDAARFAAPEGRARGVWTALAGWLAGLRREIQARRDSRLLASLDERDLADIGLRRTGIEHAVRYGRTLSDAEPIGRVTHPRPPSLAASVSTDWR
jgi:uncharacterized protein YjiS (DUF1127 family)